MPGPVDRRASNQRIGDGGQRANANVRFGPEADILGVDQAGIVTMSQISPGNGVRFHYTAALLFCIAFLSACGQERAEFDCAALDDLLVSQVEAITAAQQQLDQGNPVQEIQEDLAAVVAKGELLAEQCYEANSLDAGQNCIKLAAFGRVQDLGGLLRALHGPKLAEGAAARVFVGRMLSAARDVASKPVSGAKCVGAR